MSRQCFVVDCSNSDYKGAVVKSVSAMKQFDVTWQYLRHDASVYEI